MFLDEPGSRLLHSAGFDDVYLDLIDAYEAFEQ